MLVLALDTATLTASLAVVRDPSTGSGQAPIVLATADVVTPTHSDVLLPALDALVRDAGVAPRDLDAIAVGAGPGSFTGLRIGMATAKGIAFAADRPLWLVSSLAALAWDAAAAHASAEPVGLFVPALDARRGEVYAGFYRREGAALAQVAPERVLSPPELAAAILAHRDEGTVAVFGDALGPHLAALADLGDGVVAMPDLRRTPSGVAVAHLALHGERVDALDRGAPAYIRPAEAEIRYPDGVPGALRKR